jgi:FkbM family methyltransferase
MRWLPSWLPYRYRISRGLLRLLSRGHRGVVVVEARGIRWEIPSLVEPVAEGLICDGFYEQETVDLISRMLGIDGALVDVGANVGSISFPLALECCERRIISIEASPCIYRHLESGKKLNKFINLTTVHRAVGGADGSVIFFDAPISKFGMGSLSADRFASAGVEVEMECLDSLLPRLGVPRVDVIKIDVEGFEREVLRGARQILTVYKPVVVFEFNDWAENDLNAGLAPGDAQRFLIGIGFEIYRAKDLARGMDALKYIIETGSEDLVAVYPSVKEEIVGRLANFRS